MNTDMDIDLDVGVDMRADAEGSCLGLSDEIGSSLDPGIFPDGSDALLLQVAQPQVQVWEIGLC